MNKEKRKLAALLMSKLISSDQRFIEGYDNSEYCCDRIDEIFKRFPN